MTIARDLSKILDANGDLTIDTSTLFVDSSTNSVGIGTTSPSSVLHIKNSIPKVTIEDANNSTGGASYTPYIEFNALGDNVGSVGFSTNGNYFDIKAENYNSAPIRLFTGGSERMRIDSSGNVLVGTNTLFPAGGNNVEGITFQSSYESHFSRSNGAVIQVNRKTSDGNIVEFRKDGSLVGSIGDTSSQDLYIAGNDTGLQFNDTADQIRPCDGSGNARDNAIDLGDATRRFKDLYLGGSVYLGGTGSANALDDYEEGTWTPRILFGGSDTGTTYGAQDGTYVKVGNLITAGFFLNVSSKGSATGSASLTGMPFNAGGNGDRWGGTISYYAGLSGVSGSPNLLIEPNSNNGALRINGSTDLNNGNFNSGFSIYGVYIYTDQ